MWSRGSAASGVLSPPRRSRRPCSRCGHAELSRDRRVRLHGRPPFVHGDYFGQRPARGPRWLGRAAICRSVATLCAACDGWAVRSGSAASGRMRLAMGLTIVGAVMLITGLLMVFVSEVLRLKSDHIGPGLLSTGELLAAGGLGVGVVPLGAVTIGRADPGPAERGRADRGRADRRGLGRRRPAAGARTRPPPGPTRGRRRPPPTARAGPLRAAVLPALQ